jgi:4-amino-4-deoxy-L-arabinose transferase-like glycosyltransferase
MNPSNLLSKLVKIIKENRGLILIFLLASFLWLYRFKEALLFANDQAIDLLIARSIAEDGHRPLLGPLLSLNNIYGPPTYYYFLALAFLAGRTLVGTALVFVLINLAGLWGFYLLANRLFNKQTGLTAALLYAISYPMFVSARNMWQPHLVPVLIVFSLYFLAVFKETKRWLHLTLSLFLYAMSLSVYFSPILLLAYYWFQVRRLIKDVVKTNYPGIVTATLMVLAIGATFSPQLYYELINGFPFLKSPSLLSEVNKIPAVSKLISQILSFISFTFAPLAIRNDWWKWLAFTITEILILVYKKLSDIVNHNSKYLWVFSPIPLFLGLVVFVFFPGESHGYRLVPLLLFVLMMLAIFIKFWSKFPILFRYLLGLIVGVYLFGNFWAMATYLKQPARADDRIAVVKKIEEKILTESIKSDDFIVLVDGPDIKTKTTYDPILYPYVYFLKYNTNLDIPLEFDKTGVQLIWHNIGTDSRSEYVFLICEQDKRGRSPYDCLISFLGKHPLYELTSKDVFYSPPIDLLTLKLKS